MTNENRRQLQWVVLFLAVVLTGISVWNVVSGERGFVGWIGIVCWPIVFAASVYNLRTGGKDGQFQKD